MFKTIKSIIFDETLPNYLKRKLRGKTLKGKKTVTLDFRDVRTKIALNEKNGYIDRYIYNHGIFDPHILSEIVNNLNKDSVFLDIGANIGQHSLVSSQFCKTVYSFEPLSEIYQQFSESIRKNKFKNIKANNFALGNASGEMEIYIPTINFGGSSLVKDGLNKGFEVNSQKITIKKLDDLSEITKFDLIKIDVEGFEYEVLKGGENKIKQNQTIIILEYSYDQMEKLKPGTSKELYAFIDQILNYKIIDLKSQEKILNFSQIENIPQTDLFISPKK